MSYLHDLYTGDGKNPWHRIRLMFTDIDRTAPIPIYHMGKAGDFAVYASPQHAVLDNPFCQVLQKISLSVAAGIKSTPRVMFGILIRMRYALN